MFARCSSLTVSLTVICLLLLLGCAKGGTSIDQDSPLTDTGPGDDGSGGAGGGGGDGSGGTGSDPVCGDDQVTGNEACDGVDLQRETCTGLGFAGGQLYCDPMTCAYDTSMCLRTTTGMGQGGANGS
jgi:hypothetical protein